MQASEVLHTYRLKFCLRISRTYYLRINLSFICELMSVNITHIKPSGIRIWYVPLDGSYYVSFTV